MFVIPHSGFVIPHSGFVIPDPGFVIPDPGFVIPDSIRDPGPRHHWIADQVRNDSRWGNLSSRTLALSSRTRSGIQ